MPLDDQTELFYLVDEQDNVLGSIPRADAHANKSNIHRAVDIALLNDRGEVLLQKRSEHKDTYPNHWTISASGHVTFGQSYLEAAHRELKEELGIIAALTFVKKELYKASNETEYSVIYTAKYNMTPKDFDRDEISEVKWVPIKELSNFVKKNPVSEGGKMTLEFMGWI